MSAMNKPILAVMAAGLGSRYGGLKQIAPVDDSGHILIDYALFDAKRAGFERVVFIITKALEADFREVIGDRVAKHMEVRYAFQKLDALPSGFSVPEGRVKPWGTAHAILSAQSLVDANFAAVNADDFYGAGAFRSMYDFMVNGASNDRHGMAGYLLGNTLTENGHVARGVCKTEGSRLVEVIERTHIEKRTEGAAYTEDGVTFTDLPIDAYVSMNLWGFGLSMMDEIEARFSGWLAKNLPVNPLKGEYFIPSVVNELLTENKAVFTVLPSEDKWYGVTYANDMPVVREALARMKREGLYPERLWDEA